MSLATSMPVTGVSFSVVRLSRLATGASFTGAKETVRVAGMEAVPSVTA